MTRFASTPISLALGGLLAAALWAGLPAAAVHAQEEDSQEERLQRIEERLIELDSMVGALESLGGQDGAPAQQPDGDQAMTPPRAEPGAAPEDLARRVDAIETQIQALSGQMERMSAQLARMQAALGGPGPAPENGEAGEGGRAAARQGGAPRPRLPRGEQDRPRRAGQQQFGTTTVRPEQQSPGDGQQQARLPYGSGRQQGQSGRQQGQQQGRSGAMPWQQSPAAPSQQQGAVPQRQQQGDSPQRQQQDASPQQQQQRQAVARADPQARTAYESAYNRLLQRDFKAAASGFREFLDTYPDDPLAGNAQYWLGETHYVRGQYRDAAEAFLSGYRNYGDGDKAPANLLKLGMSLYQMGEREDACSAFSELEEKFPRASANLRQRAASESERAGC